MTLHPQIIKRSGKSEFVVLPYKEFLRIKSALEDLLDLKELRSEKKNSKRQKSVSLDKIVKDLGL